MNRSIAENIVVNPNKPDRRRKMINRFSLITNLQINFMWNIVMFMKLLTNVVLAALFVTPVCTYGSEGAPVAVEEGAVFSQCILHPEALSGSGKLVDGLDEQLYSNPLMPCMTPPTNLEGTIIRYGIGGYNAPRNGNADGHKGVDIILKYEQNACIHNTKSLPKQYFEVYAVGDGKISYARLNKGIKKNDKGIEKNSGVDTGLGFTVIIDHGKGLYSLYSHLAQDPKTNQCFPKKHVEEEGKTLTVKKGDAVKAGQIIGYMGQLKPVAATEYDGPTGNATKTDQPVQLHFELFHEDAGKNSSGTISKIASKEKRGIIDPTELLIKLGYDKKTAPSKQPQLWVKKRG